MHKLILFDIDGTLLISNGASRDAKAQAMLEVFGTDGGVRTHPFGGKTDWQILREVLESAGFTHQAIGEKMPLYEQVFARQLQARIGNFAVQALPGAMALVNTLSQRHDMLVGLVTGNTSRTAPIKLRAAGFDPDLFVVGAFGSESDDRNQLPKLALERAGQHTGQAIAAQDTIVIGDTVADVDCARAVGAVAVTVFTGYEKRENLIAAQPDYLLEDLTHFLELVPL